MKTGQQISKADYKGFQKHDGTKMEFWTKLGAQLYLIVSKIER